MLDRLLGALIAMLLVAAPAWGVTKKMNAHDFGFTSIEGEPLPLSRFSGKPVLVVNTASQCGYTPQYKDLVALSEKYAARGLTVVGVPSNDFGGQEPGSNAEIKEFCEASFDVDFPLTEKQVVSGGGAHPFFRWIVEQGGEAAAPRWNFHKYLIGPDGTLAGAWPSRISPTGAEITAAVERLLPR